MKMIRSLLLAAIILETPASAGANELASLAAKARPMTIDELFAVYAGKTWMWPTGGAYYSNKKREYLAATEDGSYALGVWFLTEDGKICGRSTWYGNYRPAPKFGCNSHRIDEEGRIYRKREPDGQWWVFRERPASKSDEFSKLKHGNLIAKQLEKNQVRYPAN